MFLHITMQLLSAVCAKNTASAKIFAQNAGFAQPNGSAQTRRGRRPDDPSTVGFRTNPTVNCNLRRGVHCAPALSSCAIAKDLRQKKLVQKEILRLTAQNDKVLHTVCRSDSRIARASEKSEPPNVETQTRRGGCLHPPAHSLDSHKPNGEAQPRRGELRSPAGRRGYGFAITLLSLCDIFPNREIFADPYRLRIKLHRKKQTAQNISALRGWLCIVYI